MRSLLVGIERVFFFGFLAHSSNSLRLNALANSFLLLLFWPNVVLCPARSAASSRTRRAARGRPPKCRSTNGWSGATAASTAGTRATFSAGSSRTASARSRRATASATRSRVKFWLGTNGAQSLIDNRDWNHISVALLNSALESEPTNSRAL